jgi:hypothetical protein
MPSNPDFTDDVPLHFVHHVSSGPDAIPLIVHPLLGWLIPRSHKYNQGPYKPLLKYRSSLSCRRSSYPGIRILTCAEKTRIRLPRGFARF